MVKGFKITEVGVIPNDWELQPLNMLCSKLVVGFVGICEPYFTIDTNGILLIRTGNLQGTKFLIEGSKYVTKEFHLRYKKSQVKSGDFLVARHGNSGNAILVPDYIKEANTLNIVIVRIENLKIDNLFVLYAINSEFVKEQVVISTAGSTQNVINTKAIGNLKIPLPPTKAEQTAIATVLNDTDQLITQLEQLLTKKRNIKTGAMQELLKPKEGWKVKKLGEVLKVKHGKSQKEVVSENGIYPILASGGLIGKSKLFLYNKPSVLIGRKGTIDEPQFMETPFWSVDTLFYTEIFDGNDAKFIFYMFNLIDWYAYNEASGVPSLNAKTIELIEKCFPKEKQEQTQIAQILSDMDNEIQEQEKELEKFKMLKQGMMQSLLTGKIRLV